VIGASFDSAPLRELLARADSGKLRRIEAAP